MANNSLTNIMAKILARALLILRKRCIMPQLVNSDYSMDAAKKGSTIDIPLFETDATVSDVSPSNAESSLVGNTPALVQITMAQWKKVAFHLTDKEMVEITAGVDFIPQEMQRSVVALAQNVNSQILSQYTGIYGFYGTPGITPFSGSQGTQPATQGRMLLNLQKAPDNGGRVGILDPVAEASALELPAFQSADKAGTTESIREGNVGRKFGIDWNWDHDIPWHVAGTWNNVVVTGSNSANTDGRSSTINVTTGGTGSLNCNVGDIIEIAGHQYTYTVSAGPGDGTTAAITASATGNITISPGLRASTASGEQITVKASHRVNILMHREAIGLAWRPLYENTVSFSGGNDMMTMQDPKTGLILRLEVKRVNKAVVWELDALWGSQLVRPQYAVRIAG